MLELILFRLRGNLLKKSEVLGENFPIHYPMTNLIETDSKMTFSWLLLSARLFQMMAKKSFYLDTRLGAKTQHTSQPIKVRWGTFYHGKKYFSKSVKMVDWWLVSGWLEVFEFGIATLANPFIDHSVITQWPHFHFVYYLKLFSQEENV